VDERTGRRVALVDDHPKLIDFEGYVAVDLALELCLQDGRLEDESSGKGDEQQAGVPTEDPDPGARVEAEAT